MNLEKELSLVENFQLGDKKATIRLNKAITTDPEKGITGASFSNEFDYLVSMGVEDIVITINSPGGNVFQGLEIYSTIQDASINTETRTVGIAASIAGIISQAGKKRTIKRHALWHAHGTRPAPGAKVSNSMLEMTTNQIKEVVRANTKLSEDEIKAIFEGETFLNAEEAKEYGLFDEIIESKVERPIQISENTDVNDLMNIFNEIEYSKKDKLNVNKMSKVNELLNLDADASEAAQIEAVEALQVEAAKVEELEAVKNEVEAKDAKIEELENALKEANQEKAETLIEAAIKDGKLDGSNEELKTSWIQNAVNDFEGTSKMLSGITTSKASESVVNAIQDNKVKEENKDNRKDWNFKKWSIEDSEGLRKMQNENPEEFEALLNAYVEEEN